MTESRNTPARRPALPTGEEIAPGTGTATARGMMELASRMGDLAAFEDGLAMLGMGNIDRARAACTDADGNFDPIKYREHLDAYELEDRLLSKTAAHLEKAAMWDRQKPATVDEEASTCTAEGDYQAGILAEPEPE